MESLNIVVLAGKVSDVDPRNSEANKAFRFKVTTHQMYIDQGEKKLDPEEHVVKLLNGKTIAKYITKGKNVTIQGRVKYAKDYTYILAEKIHFAGGGDVV